MLCQKQVFQTGGVLFFHLGPPKALGFLTRPHQPLLSKDMRRRQTLFLDRLRAAWRSSVRRPCPSGGLPAEWCVSGPHWGLVGGNVCDVLRCCSRWILNGPPPGEKDPQSAAESPLLLSPVVVKSFQSSRWGQESRDADPPARSPGTQGHLVTPALVWGGEG